MLEIQENIDHVQTISKSMANAIEDFRHHAQQVACFSGCLRCYAEAMIMAHKEPNPEHTAMRAVATFALKDIRHTCEVLGTQK